MFYTKYTEHFLFVEGNLCQSMCTVLHIKFGSSLLSSLLPVLHTVQVYMAWRSSPPPIAPVHFADDGFLHWPITRVRPQAPPDRCPGRICAGSPGGLLHSEFTQHNTFKRFETYEKCNIIRNRESVWHLHLFYNWSLWIIQPKQSSNKVCLNLSSLFHFFFSLLLVKGETEQAMKWGQSDSL